MWRSNSYSPSIDIYEIVPFIKVIANQFVIYLSYLLLTEVMLLSSYVSPIKNY